MTARIIDVEQGSPEWFAARMGIPTASEFSTVLAKGEGKTRKSYMRKLAGEIVTGEPTEPYSNVHLERGKAMEAEARELYAFLREQEPKIVGFVINERKGCSPDSFLGTDAVLEIKTALPHILIEKIEADKFPSEHVAQCQGALWVCEREWVDIAIYWPKMPLFVKRAYRDEKYIATLSDEVDRFNEELALLVERVRSYGAPPLKAVRQQLEASVNILNAG